MVICVIIYKLENRHSIVFLFDLKLVCVNKIKIFLIILFGFLLIQGCSIGIFRKAIVKKPCYGQFILVGNKVYKVCNIECLEGFGDSQKISVTYKHLNECGGSSNISKECRAMQEFDGWVEINSIKSLN